FSRRRLLGVGRGRYAPDVVAGAPAEAAPAGQAADAEVLRGKYLVEGLGHCSTCHTPRGFALQEKALTDADGTAFLSGGVVEGWLAKNLRGDTVDGLGSWSKDDIVAFLKTGVNGHSATFGGMSQVVADSTQHLTDADLNAIAAYLKTLSPVNPDATQPMAYDESAAQALRTGKDQSEGAIAFLNNCAACHRSTGKGYAQTFPQLALSSTVNSADPTSLIHIVLKGAQLPGTAHAPTRYAMPGFDWRLTDQEVASVVSFVRSSWGNQASAVSAADVAKVREEVAAAPQRAPRRPEVSATPWGSDTFLTNAPPRCQTPVRVSDTSPSHGVSDASSGRCPPGHVACSSSIGSRPLADILKNSASS